MKNEILIKRICKLIAMSYAENEETVYKIFSENRCVFKTIEQIEKSANSYKQV